jgi:hypothetical protein
MNGSSEQLHKNIITFAVLTHLPIQRLIDAKSAAVAFKI